jgi:hypothetical protein
MSEGHEPKRACRVEAHEYSAAEARSDHQQHRAAMSEQGLLMVRRAFLERIWPTAVRFASKNERRAEQEPNPAVWKSGVPT